MTVPKLRFKRLFIVRGSVKTEPYSISVKWLVVRSSFRKDVKKPNVVPIALTV